MPRLRNFRSRSLEFRRAVTSYPATILAMVAALSGFLPHRVVGYRGTPENLFSRTRSVVDRQLVILPEDPWFRLPAVERLLVQGAPVEYTTSAALQTDALIDGLSRARSADERLLGWVHYMAPHEPYRAHKGFDFGDGKRDRYKSEVAYLDSQLGASLTTSSRRSRSTRP